MKIKIYQAKGEMDANITKGYIESFGLKSSVSATNKGTSKNPRVSTGEGILFDIFVEEKDVKEVKKILGFMN